MAPFQPPRSLYRDLRANFITAVASNAFSNLLILEDLFASLKKFSLFSRILSDNLIFSIGSYSFTQLPKLQTLFAPLTTLTLQASRRQSTSIDPWQCYFAVAIASLFGAWVQPIEHVSEELPQHDATVGNHVRVFLQ